MKSPSQLNIHLATIAGQGFGPYHFHPCTALILRGTILHYTISLLFPSRLLFPILCVNILLKL